ncbi:pentapeptide repeat-containing protein [Streptomyces roseifaciens]|uniref:pentapeptide repeat-containing protein n=1 Tax=Streptomyces roseifaciens TaxID=1488406 RepID=UPI000717FF0E|nr:pentapeptide repeat-containing protein [Streptomyces roseifaciens]
MDHLLFGRARIVVPDLAEPGLYLHRVQSLERAHGSVQDFHYADADLRDLDHADVQLITGRITNLHTARLRLERVNLHSVEIDACDLGSARWTESKLTRVVFRHCKLLGAALDGLTLDHVLFESCKLDFTAFTKVRAVGPTVFSRCSLSEATFTDCDLSDAVLSDCTLRNTEFNPGRYQRLDLRGNDLSAVRGAASLSRVVIDRSQQTELGQALMAELHVTYSDDLEA